MTRIKFDLELMKTMTLFESITRSKAKDVIKREDSYLFIVMPGHIGKAIGKQASNVRRLENVFKKKVRVVEFSPDLEGFVRNLIMPFRAEYVEVQDKIITIKSPDSKTRGHLIGRAASTLRGYEEVVKRYFDIDEIKVI